MMDKQLNEGMATRILGWERYVEDERFVRGRNDFTRGGEYWRDPERPNQPRRLPQFSNDRDAVTLIKALVDQEWTIHISKSHAVKSRYTVTIGEGTQHQCSSEYLTRAVAVAALQALPE